MIPIHSTIGQGMIIHLDKLVNWYGKDELIPVCLENNIFNLYLNREVKSTETNVNNAQQPGTVYGRAVRSRVQRILRLEMLHRLVTTSNQLGNFVQMSKWEMMKMKNLWKQKIPRVRINPMNPTSRENQD